MRRSALVVTDTLNTYDHEDADALAASVERTIGPIRGLIDRALDADVELLWVNDNHGDYGASRADLIERALAGRRPDLVEPILPPDDVDFLVKIRHSVFYGTPLEHLLREREVGRIVLCGQVTEQCILYSALDAYLRGYDVAVVRDAVAHIHQNLGDAALEMMARNMHAEVCVASECELV